MKHTTLIGAFALALGIAATAPAFAHETHGPIDQRQDRQAQRLEHGIDSGSLTRGEARRLWQQQQRLRALERRFRADGYLDQRERRILQAQLDRVSDAIYRLKHNERERHADNDGYRDQPGRHSPERGEPRRH